MPSERSIPTSAPRTEWYVEDATIEMPTQVHCCDLCYCRLNTAEAQFTIVELRAVCYACQDRFSLERVKANRTIGLVDRGCYAAKGTPAPPSNNLGGRD